MKARSPSAFANQVGVALGRLCEGQGAAGSSLAGAIAEFFRAVVESVSVAPYRVRQVKTRLGQA